MKLQVLIATVGQADFSLIEKMNLQQNAIIANQAANGPNEIRQFDFGEIQMLSTRTKGVGINRNMAIQLSDADILLFADDDITYYECNLQGVIDAFAECPDADVMFFAIDMTREGKVFDARRHKTQRRRLWNSFRYGACRMAVRREAIIRNRLSFSNLFGGGCQYCSGEDTIFIRDCFRAGLKVYSHEYVLGACAKDSSSWFTGFDNKYFFDRGAMVACAFPKMKHIVKWYFLIKLRKKTNLPIRGMYKHMNAGIRAYNDLRVYQQ